MEPLVIPIRLELTLTPLAGLYLHYELREPWSSYVTSGAVPLTDNAVTHLHRDGARIVAFVNHPPCPGCVARVTAAGGEIVRLEAIALAAADGRERCEHGVNAEADGPCPWCEAGV